jgi:hypothetical protein
LHADIRRGGLVAYKGKIRTAVKICFENLKGKHQIGGLAVDSVEVNLREML